MRKESGSLDTQDTAENEEHSAESWESRVEPVTYLCLYSYDDKLGRSLQKVLSPLL